MKKANWPLIVGSIIILLLLFTMIYEDSLITADPYSLDKGIEYDMGDQVLKIEHPIKPNSIDKFGTDPLGRNLLSLLIKGTKITLGIALLATIIRLLIGVLLAAFTRNKVNRNINNILHYLLALALEIIFGFFILNQPFFKGLELNQAILAYGLILGVIGWGRTSYSLSQAIKGANNQDISKKNIVKELLPYTIVNLFLEMGRVLFTLCILGFLGITVGVNKYETVQTPWGPLPNYNPEWGGILTTAKKAIALEKYWLVVCPLLFFIISIIGFVLVGKGLLSNLKIYHTVFSKRMKRIGKFLSPKQYIYELKNFNGDRKTPLIKSVIILLIIYLIIPFQQTKDQFKINEQRAFKDLEELNEDIYEGIFTGIDGRDKATEYIAKELERAGMLPVFDEEYIQEFSPNGKNVAGYIWGRNSNYPLVIVANYDYLGYQGSKENNGLCENGTSIATTLELARSLGEKSKQRMSDRSIVFLFTDGSMTEGEGIYNVLGSKNIDINSFYIYLKYLGLEDSDILYMDTSTVSSGYKRFYKNTRNIRDRGKELGIPIKQDYFDFMFKGTEVFMENRVSGVAISGVGKDNYHKYHGQKQEDISQIDVKKLEDQIQLIMNIIVKYAWNDKPWLGDAY